MPGPDAFSLPAVPLLAPGVRVTRRDDGHLQIGLGPERAVVAADVPAVREVVRHLVAGSPPPPSTAARRLNARLLDRGLVVDGARLRGDLPASVTAAHAVAAVYTQAALAAPETVRRRAAAAVTLDVADALVAALGDVVHPVELCRRLLRASGLAVVDGSRSGGSPRVELIVAVGELARARLDGLMRADRPHLVLAFVEATARVGPFVAPGRTACVRCVDAHLGESDPRHALVVEQYAGTGPARPDGLPAPLDPAVAVAALGWAVRDVVAFVDDGRPTTWSATVELATGMQHTHTEWSRHPHCGCAWGGVARAD